MEGADIVESPRKRLKTDNDSIDQTIAPPSDAAAQEPAPPKISDGDAQALKEAEVGITEFVNAGNEGFAGILKKRYTDFLVNEILPSGQVLHLQNVNIPDSYLQATKAAAADAVEQPAVEQKQEEKPEPVGEKDAPKDTENLEAARFELSEEDKALLTDLFGAGYVPKLVSLYRRAQENPKGRPSDFGRLPTVVVNDRDRRIQIHQAVRRIFNSQLDSSTDSDGLMTVSVAASRNKRTTQGGRGPGNGQNRGRFNWEEVGGPYLHFTIYKENKDTMEVISFIARQLKMNPKGFQFAGTKDRRGVTTQRACAYRVHVDRLARLNSTLRNARLGDFEYLPHGLELGDLAGNEFVVSLRECEVPGIDLQDREAAVSKASELVGSALQNLRERGYFNYYGLQRFGTFSTRTDTVGVKMLQGDFKGACESILHFSPHILEAAKDNEKSVAPISSDDKARAEAIHIFQTTGKAAEAVEKMPRKFSAETCLIRYLNRQKNDYLGALQTIPRNLRLMYVHAYQSLVWNFAVGERWRLYGDKVVEGDLVLVHEHEDKEAPAAPPADGVDADGEVIIAPQANDSSYKAGDEFIRARALTADEAASGKYSIFDIVLPLPGYDVLYPANAMTDFYKRFMGSPQGGGLDPFEMRRKWKEVSLSGSYRKMLSRMGAEFSSEVKFYSRDDEQFVQTDLEKLTAPSAEPIETDSAEPPNKLAVVLKFQLGSSQYATMALRELMKGKVIAYKPDFGGGR
ncbi:pseudouridine synthase [Aspergillus ambiguus]|uniref:pseudouridine synthase PUS7 n=1 Tax=Aspergillus ambiguus TaxID=176160 RepID=UPI003CCDF471